MNKKESIDEKLASLLSGTNTEQQKKDVESWAGQSKRNAYQFRTLLQFWIERTPDSKLINHESVKSKIWSSYQNDTERDQFAPKRTLLWSRIGRVAAVILLLLIPTLLVLFVDQEVEEKPITTERFIEKRNPPGQKSQIQLPDGSKVWANADSEISYNEDFSDSIRRIHLEGEAYFEVMHDSIRPFEVHTDNLSVTVLGTEFNVCAYQDEDDVIVALVHGSVKVLKKDGVGPEPLLLTPGNGISYSRSIDEFHNFSMQDNDLQYKRITAWKYGTLVFDGQDFQSFTKEISRWYGMEVNIQGEPPKNWQIRATFENEYLNNILNLISFNKDFSYQLNNKELTLMFY